MSTLCPYCNQAEIRQSKGTTLYLDVAARAASIARTILELRSDPESGLRQLAQGLVDPSSLPLATENDRLCPYCRRGRVTRQAASSVWADAGARLFGVLRRVLEARGSRPGMPWFELAWMAVDERTPEPEPDFVVNAEVVEEDPFESEHEEYDFEEDSLTGW